MAKRVFRLKEYLKWQDAGKILGSSASIFFLMVVLFNLVGMEYTIPPDIICDTDCYSQVRVNSTFWAIKVEHSGDMPILYKKMTRSRTLWVNLDRIEELILTNPRVPVEILVPTIKKYATMKHEEYGYLRPIKDGDYLIKRYSQQYNPKGSRFIIHGSKDAFETVKYGLSLDSWLSEEIKFDPVWGSIGEYHLIEIAGRRYNPRGLIRWDIPINVTLYQNFTFQKSNFGKILKNKIGKFDIVACDIDYLINETYNVSKFKQTCYPYNETIFDNATSYIITHANCTDSYYLEERWKYDWKPIPNILNVQAYKPFIINIWVKKKPTLGYSAVDLIPKIKNYELTNLAWLYSSCNYYKNITITNAAGVNNITDYTPIIVSFNTSGHQTDGKDMYVVNPSGNATVPYGLKITDSDDFNLTFPINFTSSTHSLKYSVYYDCGGGSFLNSSWNSTYWSLAYDNFDTDTLTSGYWTLVGAGAKYSADDKRLNLECYEQSATTYVYRNITETFNFTMKYDMVRNSSSTLQGWFGAGLHADENELGTLYMRTNAIFHYHHGTGDINDLHAHQSGTQGVCAEACGGMTQDTTYHNRLRYNKTGEMGIYTYPNFSFPVTGSPSTCAAYGMKGHERIYIMSSVGSGAANRKMCGWVDNVRVRPWMETEPTISIGAEQTSIVGAQGKITVALNDPSDAGTETDFTVLFNYTPAAINSSQTEIYNCSLYNNISGTWALVHTNTSIILNNTKNNISETFSSNGTYIWNVGCWNSTTEVFASSNYTVTIAVAVATPFDFNVTLPSGTTTWKLNVSSCTNGCYQSGTYQPLNQSGTTPFFTIGNNGTVTGSVKTCLDGYNITTYEDDTEDAHICYDNTSGFSSSPYHCGAAIDEDWTTYTKNNATAGCALVYENYTNPSPGNISLANWSSTYTISAPGANYGNFIVWYRDNEANWVILFNDTSSSTHLMYNTTNTIPSNGTENATVRLRSRICIGSEHESWYYEGKMYWNISEPYMPDCMQWFLSTNNTLEQSVDINLTDNLCFVGNETIITNLAVGTIEELWSFLVFISCEPGIVYKPDFIFDEV